MEIDLTDVKQEKPKPILAKYNSLCGACDVPIVKHEDMIVMVEGEGWCHEECG